MCLWSPIAEAVHGRAPKVGLGKPISAIKHVKLFIRSSTIAWIGNDGQLVPGETSGGGQQGGEMGVTSEPGFFSQPNVTGSTDCVNERKFWLFSNCIYALRSENGGFIFSFSPGCRTAKHQAILFTQRFCTSVLTFCAKQSCASQREVLYLLSKIPPPSGGDSVLYGYVRQPPTSAT